MKNLTLFFFSALVFALLGCSQKRQFEGECSANGDCPVGAFCRGGLCACRSDEACDNGEICNSQGVCQKRAGCRRNAECPDPNATFCDIATGNCIDKIKADQAGVSAGCGSNVHCDPGFICDTDSKKCIEGCFANADCPLYRVCNRTQTTGPGRCVAGMCGDKTFCAFGEVCNAGTCAPSPDQNHCSACNNQPGDCGDPDNFCLINPNYDPNDASQGSQFFCGVSCQQGNDTCPNGYGCGGVVLLTQDQCTMNSACCDPNVNPQECCPDGQRDCQNRRQCVVGEGDARGACTCLRNEDCAIDELPPACVGSCGGLGLRACRVDGDCQALPCDLTRKMCQRPANRSCNNDSECDSFPICADLGTGSTVCIFDGRPCATPADCLCGMDGTCVGTGRPCAGPQDCEIQCQNGGCVLGAACAPNEGLSCEDVR